VRREFEQVGSQGQTEEQTTIELSWAALVAKTPLSERLERAILEIVCWNPSDATHQDSWSGWTNSIRRRVPEFTDADLRSAFRRLWKSRTLRLTKLDSQRGHPEDYSGIEADDNRFFFSGWFNGTITDEGRSEWDRLHASNRIGVFISHITEEKPVAQVLQKYLKIAFGNDFRVFVSSDAKSIGGGKKWYTHIIDNLRLSEVVLVLVSQESKGKEWINFEAGFGEGADSLLIPVGIKNISFGQISYPLAGVQGRNIDDIGSILDDIGDRIGTTPASVDSRAYLEELRDAEAQLTYKSLVVEPVKEGNALRFDIQNVGNVDLELLMLEVYIPASFFLAHIVYDPILGDAGVDRAFTSRNGVSYQHLSCYSARGVYGNIVPTLRPIITPSMGKIRPSFGVRALKALDDDERKLSIFFQVHAIGYRTEEEERKVADIPSWT
jgi:hypothetical protein